MARGNICNGCKGTLFPFGNAEGVVWRDDVYEMEGNLLTLGECRFGGTDVHTAVDLHRVCAYDFSGDTLCESGSYIGLTDCCGTCDDNDRAIHFGEQPRQLSWLLCFEYIHEAGICQAKGRR